MGPSPPADAARLGRHGARGADHGHLAGGARARMGSATLRNRGPRRPGRGAAVRSRVSHPTARSQDERTSAHHGVPNRGRFGSDLITHEGGTMADVNTLEE